MGGLGWARLRADVLALCAVANFTLSYALTKVALDEWHARIPHYELWVDDGLDYDGPTRVIKNLKFTWA